MFLELALSTALASPLPRDSLPLGTSRGYSLAPVVSDQRAPRNVPLTMFAEQTDPGKRFLVSVEVESLAARGLARLRKFMGFTANWDGEGAPSPDRKTLESATTLLGFLAGTSLHFGIHLDADSRPVFYLRDNEFEGEITVTDSEHLSFCFERGSEIFEGYALEFDCETLPAELDAAVERVAAPDAPIRQTAA